jgi:hypothetical protein
MTDIRIPTADRCLHVLRGTTSLLRNLLAPVPKPQLDWQPSADRWSISMVLAHLADVETGGFRSRFEAMLRQDLPWLPAYDQFALFRSRTEFDAQAELAGFERERGITLELLNTLPQEAGERSGRHEKFGTITVAQLLNEFAFHDLGHIRQIMELYRSRVFYPEMGPYQGYYKISP